MASQVADAEAVTPKGRETPLGSTAGTLAEPGDPSATSTAPAGSPAAGAAASEPAAAVPQEDAAAATPQAARAADTTANATADATADPSLVYAADATAYATVGQQHSEGPDDVTATAAASAEEAPACAPATTPQDTPAARVTAPAATGGNEEQGTGACPVATTSTAAAAVAAGGHEQESTEAVDGGWHNVTPDGAVQKCTLAAGEGSKPPLHAVCIGTLSCLDWCALLGTLSASVRSPRCAGQLLARCLHTHCCGY